MGIDHSLLTAQPPQKVCAMAWLAPRGISPLRGPGLFALRLDEAGGSGACQLQVSLVFLHYPDDVVVISWC